MSASPLNLWSGLCFLRHANPWWQNPSGTVTSTTASFFLTWGIQHHMRGISKSRGLPKRGPRFLEWGVQRNVMRRLDWLFKNVASINTLLECVPYGKKPLEGNCREMAWGDCSQLASCWAMKDLCSSQHTKIKGKQTVSSRGSWCCAKKAANLRKWPSCYFSQEK